VKQEMGLREQHKQDKQQRIKEAATELFRQKGFETATIKEIAERAGVAPGTVFLYAKDKQDLLVLIFLDGIDECIEQAFATLPSTEGLLDELVHIFGTFFQFYARQPELARHFVKELPFTSREGQRQEAIGQIYRFTKRLAERVGRAQARGEISSYVNIEAACENFFALYYATLVFWLSEPTPIEIVTERLKNSLELQIRGMLR
jgi:TetR/AcrR family transcriptional regulator, cholesterol catabolism regulator